MGPLTPAEWARALEDWAAPSMTDAALEASSLHWRGICWRAKAMEWLEAGVDLLTDAEYWAVWKRIVKGNEAKVYPARKRKGGQPPQ